jgi:hypothetical protein
MERWTWCVQCQRVWETAQLVGEWPEQRCPDSACGGRGLGALLPYGRTRRLMAPDWPEQPTSGERYAMRSEHERNVDD